MIIWLTGLFMMNRLGSKTASPVLTFSQTGRSFFANRNTTAFSKPEKDNRPSAKSDMIYMLE